MNKTNESEREALADDLRSYARAIRMVEDNQGAIMRDCVEAATAMELAALRIEGLNHQLHEAVMSTHRQALCIQQCAAAIGPETSATIDGLPMAVRHVVKERDAALARASGEARDDEYKRMFEDAVRCLAAIDEALGIDPDEAGGAAPILNAIEELKAEASARQGQRVSDAEIDRLIAKYIGRPPLGLHIDCRRLARALLQSEGPRDQSFVGRWSNVIKQLPMDGNAPASAPIGAEKVAEPVAPHRSHDDSTVEALERLCARLQAQIDSASTPAEDARDMWRHIKTGGLYELMTLAQMEDDDSTVVVYKAEHSGIIWVRPLSEFEAKFERASPAPFAEQCDDHAPHPDHCTGAAYDADDWRIREGK